MSNFQVQTIKQTSLDYFDSSNTLQYVGHLLQNKNHIPFQVMKEYITTCKSSVEHLVKFGLQMIENNIVESDEPDTAMLLFISVLTTQIQQVTNQFAQQYQEVLLKLFKLHNCYKELILINLSYHYQQNDKLAQFSLHLIKTFNVSLLTIKQDKYVMHSAPLIQIQELQQLVETNNNQKIYDNPKYQYFSNLFKYLQLESQKVKQYAEQKFQELILCMEAKSVAQQLFKNNFKINLENISKEEILDSQEKLHPFIPKNVLYELVQLKKIDDLVVKERIKYQQQIEPEIEEFLYPQTIRSQLEIQQQGHRFLIKTFEQLYKSTNPFINCTYSSDIFEDQQEIPNCIKQYLQFVEILLNQDLNENYNQAFEYALQFVQSVLIYHKQNVIDNCQDVLDSILNICIDKQFYQLQKFNGQIELLMDAYLIRYDLNQFACNFLKDINDPFLQKYITSRISMLLLVCASEDLFTKLEIDSSTIQGICEEIQTKKQKEFEVLFNQISVQQYEQQKFSLFASTKKMSYYLVKKLIIKLLELEKNSRVINLLNNIYKTFIKNGGTNSEQAIIIQQIISLFDDIWQNNINCQAQTQEQIQQVDDEEQQLEKLIKQSNNLLVSQIDKEAQKPKTPVKKQTKQLSFVSQYQQLISQQEKINFLNELMKQQQDYKFDLLQLLNKQLQSEINSTVLQQIAMVFIQKPSPMVARYCMEGIFALLLNHKLKLVGQEVLNALDLKQLFNPQLFIKSNELAYALINIYEKQTQRHQIELINLLLQEMQQLVDENQNNLAANDFIKKLYKSSCDNRYGTVVIYRQFCIICEKLFNVQQSRVSTPVKNLRSVSGSYAPRSPGSQNKQSPRIVNNEKLTTSQLQSENNTPIKRSNSQIKNSGIYAPRSASQSKVKPINQALQRQQENKLTSSHDISYIKQQLLIAFPTLQLNTLSNGFEIVKDCIRNLEKYEFQLDMLYQYIISKIKEEVQPNQKLHLSQTKLIEQFLKTLKVSSYNSHAYIVSNTIYFCLNLVEYINEQNTKLIQQLILSFHQTIDDKFFKQILKMELTSKFGVEILLKLLLKCQKNIYQFNDQQFQYQIIYFIFRNRLQIIGNDSQLQQLCKQEQILELFVNAINKLQIKSLQQMFHFIEQFQLLDQNDSQKCTSMFQPFFEDIQQIPALALPNSELNTSLKLIESQINQQNLQLTQILQDYQSSQIGDIESQLLESHTSLNLDQQVLELYKNNQNINELVKDENKLTDLQEKLQQLSIQKLDNKATINLIFTFLLNIIENLHNDYFIKLFLQQLNLIADLVNCTPNDYSSIIKLLNNENNVEYVQYLNQLIQIFYKLSLNQLMDIFYELLSNPQTFKQFMQYQMMPIHFFHLMISNSIEQLKEKLNQQKVPTQIIDNIICDVKHEIERLPNDNLYMFSNNSLCTQKEISQENYVILKPMLTLFTSELCQTNFQQYFENDPNNFINLLNNSKLVSFPDQFKVLDQNLLLQYIKANITPSECKNEQHQICLDDISLNNQTLDISNCNICDLSPDYVQFDIFKNDIKIIDVSNNQLLKSEQILDFLRIFTNTTHLIAVNQIIDQQLINYLNQQHISLIQHNLAHTDFKVQQFYYIEAFDEESEVLSQLQKQNVKEINTIICIKEPFTNQLFDKVFQQLQQYKVKHLIVQEFDKAFNFSNLNKIKSITRVNFNLIHNVYNILLNQQNQIQLDFQQFSQLSQLFTEYCYKNSHLIKTNDHKEIIDTQTGKFLLQDYQNCYALALFPSYLQQVEKSYNYSNFETGINCLSIIQLLPSNDIALIIVPLRKIKSNQQIITNGSDNYITKAVVQFLHKRKINYDLNELYQKQYKNDQLIFNKYRKQLSNALNSLQYVFEANDYGILSYIQHIQQNNYKNILMITNDFQRIYSVSCAIVLLVSRAIHWVALLNTSTETKIDDEIEFNIYEVKNKQIAQKQYKFSALEDKAVQIKMNDNINSDKQQQIHKLIEGNYEADLMEVEEKLIIFG